MIVHGQIHTKVTIEPLDVIQNLIEEIVSSRCWVVKKGKKSIVMIEESAGPHSRDVEYKILTPKEAKMYEALLVVKEQLKKK